MNDTTAAAPKRQWTSVRLETVTADALAAYAVRLGAAVKTNPGAFPAFLTANSKVSQGTALLYLLWQQSCRSARGRRCQACKRKASRATLNAVEEATLDTDVGIPAVTPLTAANPIPNTSDK